MTELAPLNTAPLPVKLRIEDYLLLDPSDAFEAYRKAELIGGEIYFRNARHRPHARIKWRLFVAIAATLSAFDTGLEALVEASVAMPPDGAPEPDIVVTSDPEGGGLIPLASVRLIVEVPDTTLAYDTDTKCALYARDGVPEYWVADVEANVIHQLWAPEGEAYTQHRAVAFGERIEAVTVAIGFLTNTL